MTAKPTLYGAPDDTLYTPEESLFNRRVDVDPVPDFIYNYRTGVNDDLGTYTAPDYRIGKVGPNDEKCAAVHFDGTSYYTDNAKSGVFGTIADGAMTICMWIKAHYDTTFKNYITNGVGGAGTLLFGTTSLGQLRYISDGAGKTSTINSLNDGAWHFVAITFSGTGGTVTFYIDGASEAVAATAYNLVDTGALRLGQSTNGAASVKGDLSDLRIYNRVLSASELTSIQNFTHDGSIAQDNKLITWADATNISKLTEAAGLVSQMDDSGPNGLDWVRGGVGLEPLAFASDINDRNALDYTGDVDYMKLSTVLTSGTYLLHQYLDIKSTDSEFDSILAHTGTGTDYQIEGGDVAGLVFDGKINGAGPPLTATGGPYSGKTMVTCIFDFDNLTKSIYINGTFRGSNSYNSALELNTELRINMNRGIFASPDAAHAHTALTYGIHLREFMEGCTAWDVEITTDLSVGNPRLPVDHKYKKAPPKRIA